MNDNVKNIKIMGLINQVQHLEGQQQFSAKRLKSFIPSKRQYNYLQSTQCQKCTSLSQ